MPAGNAQDGASCLHCCQGNKLSKFVILQNVSDRQARAGRARTTARRALSVGGAFIALACDPTSCNVTLCRSANGATVHCKALAEPSSQRVLRSRRVRRSVA